MLASFEKSSFQSEEMEIIYSSEWESNVKFLFYLIEIHNNNEKEKVLILRIHRTKK